MASNTPKTCSTCDWHFRSFWGQYKCENPTVVAALDRVRGRPVNCNEARQLSHSPCGIYGFCYEGDANSPPLPSPQNITFSSSGLVTASYLNNFSTFPLVSSFANVGQTVLANYTNRMPPTYSSGIPMVDSDDDTERSASEESPWEGKGGTFNGGGATGDW